MKKFVIIILVLPFFISCKIIDEDKEEKYPKEGYEQNLESREKPSAQIALDWEGTYSGVLPCDNCAGIETYLTLREDHSFEMVQRSIKTIGDESPENKTSGEFNWNEEGTAISLPALEGELRLGVEDLYLVPLNAQNAKIPAEPGNNFKLMKQ